VRAGMRTAAHPPAVWVLMSTKMGTTTDPGSIRILVGSRMCSTADPGSIRILMCTCVSLENKVFVQSRLPSVVMAIGGIQKRGSHGASTPEA
jgi:hypothetical protein